MPFRGHRASRTAGGAGPGRAGATTSRSPRGGRWSRGTGRSRASPTSAPSAIQRLSRCFSASVRGRRPRGISPESDVFEQPARLRLAGNDGGPTRAAGQGGLFGHQGELPFLERSTVALQAVSRQDGSDLGIEGRRAGRVAWPRCPGSGIGPSPGGTGWSSRTWSRLATCFESPSCRWFPSMTTGAH